ncbi:MAG: hypothetical protein HGN29_09020 [Asgard group archaeon]|nr:hypothetical protein [Asgard group archaeon]
MNKRVKISTVFILGLLIASMNFSAFSQAVVVSNQLSLKADSYVKGKYLYSNTSVFDLELADITINIDKIFDDVGTTFTFVQITTTMEVATGQENPLGLEDITTFSYTSLIFEHNRTTFLPAARILASNASFSLEISVIYLDTIGEMMEQNNTKITIDGSSYIFGDVDSLSPIYIDVLYYLLFFIYFNDDLLDYHKYTPFAINPDANVGDTIRYVPTNGLVEAEGSLLTNGNSYDILHVRYDNTFAFLMDDVDEIEVYYESKTGLLIRSIEKDTSSDSQFELSPYEIEIKASSIPFPFFGAIISLVAIGITIVFLRKKK